MTNLTFFLCGTIFVTKKIICFLGRKKRRVDESFCWPMWPIIVVSVDLTNIEDSFNRLCYIS